MGSGVSGRRRVPWLALGLGCLVVGLLAGAWVMEQTHLRLPACLFKEHTGFACATCGLTRSVLALADGRWADAFHFHPVALIGLLLSPLAMGWDLRRAWRGAAYPALPDSLAWRLGAVGLLLGTWILQAARGI